MDFAFKFVMRLFITMIVSLILTPIIKLISFKIGAVDRPGDRRINTKTMPTAGGLSIFLSFSFALLWEFRAMIPFDYVWPMLLGAAIVVVTGLLDDIFELTPMQKTLGLTLAALEIYFVAGIKISTVSIPYLGVFDLGWLGLPMTILWILAITNAVNLIDGLDGLASGVSIISLTTIGIISYFFLPNSVEVPMVIFTLIAAIVGFFPYNFYPATIFLGDTGALFLGFMISVLSLQGLKNATFITVITPMLILGVPITDTVYAMIRRKFNKQKISSADKMHLHHRLLSLGFTHRGTVLTIYALAMVFSFIALLMNYASNTAIILLIISTGFGIELFIELIGLVGENRQPLMCALKFLGNRRFRQKVLKARAEKRKDKQEEESEDLAASASQIKEKRRKRKHYQAKHKK
ncbi:undecaprenyl/decaprenyl-phosphate alpha-N-acetylglucosaminyl 1-phosphate transferase [Enterococcus casseliflavus]|uniref:glycosyltransferase family 4 protein n=1 Tax=Enterococcus TaxID=1350 RepID=UPI001127C448|nr:MULTISPECIES: MraY family glycosyltransferase [Enterococcus]MBF0011994.1 undecaprenyl/decaprenyl-phosphate alpha-N-acetylglucosaminyl 1-phosphate transferase [Enterococcus casseliflavus]MEB5919698.1 undecaprenyl/decaprenyl-phosphate alpha-N-acetylglucosaminyl 1-phosphate transferase [Enterococcus innesii]TPR57267.1 undecaprenyl/decaprenyl-phosphate alpha-N-acetylglucosaminyl 1-phosphate transferase [Enterococcus sp. OL5]